jgi:hypothetical protein
MLAFDLFIAVLPLGLFNPTHPLRQDSYLFFSLFNRCHLLSRVMATTRISELTSIIAANAAKVDEYLVSEGLPTPSFDADSPPKLVVQGPVATYRQAILDATDELHALMLGPIGILTSPSVSLHARKLYCDSADV